MITRWVTALRTRLSHWQRAWGRCFSLWAGAHCVVAPTQTRRQWPSRARPTEESRINEADAEWRVLLDQYTHHHFDAHVNNARQQISLLPENLFLVGEQRTDSKREALIRPMRADN